jgi:chemotaxis protein methyltransferase CheR
MNLQDSNQTGVLGRFDVIFCRNVLIYFDRESRMQAVDLFHRRLNPTGYLLLGHSESLLNRETPFIQVDLNDTAVYQKQEEDIVQ